MVRTTSLVVNVSSVSGHCKILAAKVGTSFDPADPPCQPVFLVSLPALSACLPCQPACLVRACSWSSSFV
jgi:hypothetical protein